MNLEKWIYIVISAISLIGAGYAWFRLAGTRKQHELSLQIDNLVKLVDTYSNEAKDIEVHFKARMASLKTELIQTQEVCSNLSLTVQEQKEIIERQNKIISKQDKLLNRYRVKYGGLDGH